MRVVLAFGILGAIALVGASAEAAPFDGNWGTTLNCPKAPDGAAAYTFKFVSHVKEGALHGQYGKSGQPASRTLEGTVAADGAVTLNADGITGDPNYAVKHVQSGSPYHYTATGHFAGSRGTAHRSAQRVCDYTFVKQ